MFISVCTFIWIYVCMDMKLECKICKDIKYKVEGSPEAIVKKHVIAVL